VAGMDVLELRHRADVAGAQLGNRQLLFALQQLEFANALLVILGGVPVAAVGLECSGVHAEERHAPGKWIRERLEYQRRRECLRAPLEGRLFALAVAPLDGPGFVWGRQERDDRVENRMSRDVVRSGIEQHREDLMM